MTDWKTEMSDEGYVAQFQQAQKRDMEAEVLLYLRSGGLSLYDLMNTLRGRNAEVRFSNLLRVLANLTDAGKIRFKREYMVIEKIESEKL